MTHGNGNGGGIALPHAPQRIGQATLIEQSRAAAEVHAAILVAQECPRDPQGAQRDMRDACRMKALAERAFFRFPRAGQTVSGPSVHLARELARCWGNIQYGVAELSRDDSHGQSEVQAYAWDVQTNSRSVHVFIVPHKRDKKGGPEALTDMRDIYENNANNGARRLREAIFAVLPVWFVKEAEDICRETLKREDDGKSIHQRIAEVIDWFGRLGIREEQIAAKLGRASSRWDEQDVASLGVIYRSIKNGEVTKEDEFPVATVTAAEITASAASAAKPDGPITGQQTQRLRSVLDTGEVGAATERDLLTKLTGHPVATVSELTEAEGKTVGSKLVELGRGDSLIDAIAEFLDRPESDTQPGGAR